MSFLVGLIAMANFSRQAHRHASLVMNSLGALVVAFTLAINLGRGDPIASIAAALLIALALYGLWRRAGRPRGIAQVVVEAERVEAQPRPEDADGDPPRAAARSARRA
jgi:hypothetical protein